MQNQHLARVFLLGLFCLSSLPSWRALRLLALDFSPRQVGRLAEKTIKRQQNLDAGML